MKNQRITVIIGTLIIISNFINCASKEKLRQIPYSKKPFKLSNKKIACISALNDNYSRTLAYKMAYYFNSRRNIKVYDPQVANQYTVKYYLTFRTAAINHPHGNIFEDKFISLMDSLPVDYLFLVWVSSVYKKITKERNVGGGSSTASLSTEKDINYTTNCEMVVYDCINKVKLRYFSYRAEYSVSKSCGIGFLIVQADTRNKQYKEFIDSCAYDFVKDIVKYFE